MRILLIICLSLFVFACTGQIKESPEETQAEEEIDVLPTTCQTAIETIASELDEDSIKTLRETKKEDLVMFHFSWGMGIRNGYGLWAEQSPIRLSCAEQVGERDIHPDNASGIIMEGVWKLANEKNM